MKTEAKKPPVPNDFGVDVEADARKFRMFIIILLSLLILGAIVLFVTLVLEAQLRRQDIAVDPPRVAYALTSDSWPSYPMLEGIQR